VSGQLKLRSSAVLIVGSGGLGCPAALYLAGAGVGTLGLVDGDEVEPSNLHRQVLHRSRNVGKFKVDSAIEYLHEYVLDAYAFAIKNADLFPVQKFRLNPHPTYVAHREHLTSQNAPEIFESYDLILDCTDNPTTRYLISDASVLLGKPLVSASALRTEGQLMVLNNPPRPPGDKTGGPCYRCVFPKPPPADSVISCADGGILGPVVGTMGVLQALEAIKIITTVAATRLDLDSNSSADTDPGPEYPSLLLFSAYSTPKFRTIRIRSRRETCAVCSANATVSLTSLRSGLTDYVLFCGSVTTQDSLSSEERISPLEYRRLHPSPVTPNGIEIPSAHVPGTNKPPILIDVRDKVQFDICRLDNSLNIPITTLLSEKSSKPSWLPSDIVSADSKDSIYVVCRLGNDSQLAVRKLKGLGLDHGGKRYIGDIRGGLRAWRAEVDPDWPEY
jgi:adenylyltransferase/sulfurtransferase